MSRPSLAVLITYHDEGDLLVRSLETVAAQTSAPDEILVYDDASYDPAERHLGRFAGLCRVVRSGKNGGPGYGRNVLLGETRCDYVHFHDADDLLLPSWGGKVWDAIDRGRPDMVLTEVCYEMHGVLSDRIMGFKKLEEDPDLVRFALSSSILPASATVRREKALEAGGYRTRDVMPQSEDFDFHLRLAAADATYAVVDESLVRCMWREASHSHAGDNSAACWTSMVESLKMAPPAVRERYAVAVADAAARAASNLYQLGKPGDARKAYEAAASLGRPSFAGRSNAFRWVAGFFGPMAAENLSRFNRDWRNR